MAEEKKKEVAYELTEIVTGTSPATLNKETKETMNVDQVLVQILNDLDEIKKAVA